MLVTPLCRREANGWRGLGVIHRARYFEIEMSSCCIAPRTQNGHSFEIMDRTLQTLLHSKC